MRTSKELIDYIDDVLNDKYGKPSCTKFTLPNGTIIDTDTGYVCEFWDDFKSLLDEEWFK